MISPDRKTKDTFILNNDFFKTKYTDDGEKMFSLMADYDVWIDTPIAPDEIPSFKSSESEFGEHTYNLEDILPIYKPETFKNLKDEEKQQIFKYYILTLIRLQRPNSSKDIKYLPDTFNDPNGFKEVLTALWQSENNNNILQKQINDLKIHMSKENFAMTILDAIYERKLTNRSYQVLSGEQKENENSMYEELIKIADEWASEKRD